jgi:hypothetical protein
MAVSAKRTLVLLRHAKSAWPDVPDHERPRASLTVVPVHGPPRWWPGDVSEIAASAAGPSCVS